MSTPPRSKSHVLVFIAIVTALTALAPVAARPDARGGDSADAEERVARQIDQLSRELDLTDEQRTQVEPILLDAARQLEALRADADAGGGRGGNRGAMREKAEKIQKETDGKLAEVFDDGQMKRYRELAEERRKQMRERHRGGRAQRDR